VADEECMNETDVNTQGLSNIIINVCFTNTDKSIIRQKSFIWIFNYIIYINAIVLGLLEQSIIACFLKVYIWTL